MREIPLTQGQVALVDDEDYARLSIYKWYPIQRGNTFYAVRNSLGPNNHHIYMHHEIMGRPAIGLEVDHIDGDGLNNQKINLREVTHSQNHMNQRPTNGSSKFKGVSWHSRNNKWQTQIQFEGSHRHLGYFISEEEAARAYDVAALEYFGEFARPNFLPEASR